jgi:prolipoprotein diacylglyceryltransferase
VEPTLLWAALTGVGSAWLVLWVPRVRSRLPASLERPLDLLVGAAAVGLLTGRLAAMVRSGTSPLTDPLDVLAVRGGVDTGFAALGAIAALVLASRRDLPASMDALAPAAVAGIAGWHAGCVWRGACLGARSDLPWAWAAAGSDVTRHPVELYTAVLLGLAAAGMTLLPARRWLASGAALAAVAGVRLLTESMRPSILGGPVAWYAAGVVVGMGMVVWSLAAGAATNRP